MADQHLEQE